METETWEDIPDYEGLYQVSDMGRVRSLDREVECVTRRGTTYVRKLKGRVLRPAENGRSGHLAVLLSREGCQETKAVASLVMAVFYGPRPDGHVIEHRNGLIHDNNLGNLRYVSDRWRCRVF